MITSRPRSPRDDDGPPRKRQRVSDAQHLQKMHRHGAANIAGPSTSTAVADPMLDIANFDDVDMLSEAVEGSDPECWDEDVDNRPESQSNSNRFALGINRDEEQEEMEVANKSMVVTFNTDRTSLGGTVNNINGDHVTHINFNLMPGWAPPEAMDQIPQHFCSAFRKLSRSMAQLPRSSESRRAQITKISVADVPFYNPAIHSINQVRVIISIIQNMMANPMLCSCKDLPETLASLKRLLTLMELALRAYRHTDLWHSLSNAISAGAEECRQLLDDLTSNLTNSRQVLSNAVLYYIRKYVWAKIGGQSSTITALDTKLRKSHSSFAACLLALGRAAWPELKRGMGRETLDELAKFYVALEQESTSLRHIKVDAVIVQDHLGRNLHVPMIFCTSSKDFHVVMSGFCRGLAGDGLIRRGDYRILNSEDDQVINPEKFAIVLQPGMAVDMSIVFHEQAEERQGSEGHSCPRCQHVNGRCAGWVICAHCSCRFTISPEEESIISPETEEHVNTDFIPDERYLFRNFSIFQAAAGIATMPHSGTPGFPTNLDPTPIRSIPEQMTLEMAIRTEELIENRRIRPRQAFIAGLSQPESGLVWEGALTWRGFDVATQNTKEMHAQVKVVSLSRTDIMPRTWPITLDLTPSRKPMAAPEDIQTWVKSTKASLCSFSPKRSSDPRINGQNLRSLSELLSDKRIVRPLYFLLSASSLMSMLVRIGFLDAAQWQNFKQYFDVSIQQQFIGGRFPHHWPSRSAIISGHAWNHTDTCPASTADSPSTSNTNTPSISGVIKKAKSVAKTYRYRSNGK